MIRTSLLDVTGSVGCVGFSFVNLDGERVTFVYLRDGEGRPVSCLILKAAHWSPH